MRSRAVAVYGLYTAIFLIFGLVPNLGYMTIGPISLTTMALPITIMSVHKGCRGALFGLFMFALTSSIALSYLGGIFIATLGLGKSLVIFFGGRILIFIPLGLYLFATRNMTINYYFHGFIIALIISIFNSVFVLTLFVVFDFSSLSFVKWFIVLGITNLLPEWLIIPVLGAGLGKLGAIFKAKEESIQAVAYH